MSQTFTPTLSKAKEASFSRKLDELLARLQESNRATLEIYKDIDKLRRSNDIAYKRAKKAVDALSKY